MRHKIQIVHLCADHKTTGRRPGTNKDAQRSEPHDHDGEIKETSPSSSFSKLPDEVTREYQQIFNLIDTRKLGVIRGIDIEKVSDRH